MMVAHRIKRKCIYFSFQNPCQNTEQVIVSKENLLRLHFQKLVFFWRNEFFNNRLKGAGKLKSYFNSLLRSYSSTDSPKKIKFQLVLNYIISSELNYYITHANSG